MTENVAMPDAGTWASFAADAPDLARDGRALLEDAPGVPGAAFLATVGADGRPRMHPFVPAIVDEHLYAFVVDSPKRRDLDRDGCYAIHSMLGPSDASFFLAGRARAVDDSSTRSHVAEHMPFGGIDDGHRLYEFLVDRALLTTWTTPTNPVYRRWRRS